MIISIAGLITGTSVAYLGLAASVGWTPFHDKNAHGGQTVGQLAADLASPYAGTRRAAVAAPTTRLGADHPDRPAAIAALVSLLSSADHSAMRADGQATELDDAFEALGHANIGQDPMDLRS